MQEVQIFYGFSTTRKKWLRYEVFQLWTHSKTKMVLVKEIILQILKRARGHSDGDIATFNYRPPAGLQDELNYRTWKAGYTDRDGRKKDPPKIRIFGGIGESEPNLWPRDENGNLIDD